jgi:hypothetical protein
MNDLETRLREELGRLPAAAPIMPLDTPRLVRRRRARTLVSAGLVAVALFLGVAVVSRPGALPTTVRPAATPDVPDRSSRTSASPFAHDTGTASDAPTPSGAVRFGSPPGDGWAYLDPIVEPTWSGDSIVQPVYGVDATPYVDLESPSPVAGKKIVLTYGTVAGAEFSLAAYNTTGDAGSNGSGTLELFWGHAAMGADPGEYGGGSSLGAGLRSGEDLSLLLDARSPRSGAPFEVLYGWTSLKVDHLDIRMDDGWTQRVQVQRAGPVSGYGWVLAFIPKGLGAAVAVTAGGQALSSWPLCVGGGAGVAPTCPS